MEKYHKIYNLWKRDAKTHKYIEGDFFNSTFQYCQNLYWAATEKIDGMNIRVIWDAGCARVLFRGKTDAAMLPTKLRENLETQFPVEKLLSFPAFTLYGEGYGAGIQKAGVHYIANDQKFILFDILDHQSNRWLPRNIVEDIAKDLGVDIVPTVAVGSLTALSNYVKFGFQSLYGDIPAEGVVARPVEELCNRWGERIIVKIKTKDFGMEAHNCIGIDPRLSMIQDYMGV